MKKLVRLDRVLEQAEERGEDPSTLVVNPDDVFSLDAQEDREPEDEDGED